ncbi:MAG: DUF987 family protein [Rhodanobacter sp.]
MQITTRAKALRKIKNRTDVTFGRYDRGRYKWNGSAADYVGKETLDLDGLLAVWVERRLDAHGPYAALMSASVRRTN